MGSICHLANEFQLSYDMYERSANVFLKDKDTLSYCYALNDMAFELAEQGKKKEAYFYLDSIAKNCSDQDALMNILITKSEACIIAQQYDSVLYYSYMLSSMGNKEPIVYILLAQAYSYIGRKDSAVYYANYVLSISDELFNINSALYILTHDDNNKDREDVRKVSADRSDAQKLIEIRRSKLSQAVQLLEQDLNRKANILWLLSIIGTLIIIGIIIGIYVSIKLKKQTLLSQKIEHLETEYTYLQMNKRNLVEQTCAILRKSNNLSTDLNWKDYHKMCKFVNEHFYLLATKLTQEGILNETEIRLCVLVLIGLNRAEIAKTLPYAPNSVGKLKDHTAKLLGTTGKKLRDFLLGKTIEG